MTRIETFFVNLACLLSESFLFRTCFVAIPAVLIITYNVSAFLSYLIGTLLGGFVTILTASWYMAVELNNEEDVDSDEG